MKRILKWLAMQFGPTRRFLEERGAFRDRCAHLEMQVRTLSANIEELMFNDHHLGNGSPIVEHKRDSMGPGENSQNPKSGEMLPHGIGADATDIPKFPYHPPIIICGPPRSGTTFVQELINAHHSFAISNEFSLATHEAVIELFDQIELFANIIKANSNPKFEIPQRKAFLMRQLWRTFGRPYGPWGSTSEHRLFFGMKTPRAESAHRFYDRVFELNPPKYILCVRHPGKVFRSIDRLKNWPLSLKGLESTYRISWNSYSELKTLRPKRLHVVQLDRVGQSERERIDFARSLFHFLGVDIDESSRKFVAEWRRVNTGHKTEIADNESKLKAFLRSPGVAAYCEHFGYTVEELDIN